jgi:hypothetical protein
MPRRKLACLIVAVLVAGAFVACSDQSPVAPGATPDGVGDASLLGKALLGLYQLSFVSGGQEVSSLPVCTPGSVCQELGLKATVVDASGVPATSGTVAFEYCSFKGLPPNDPERADEAPREACKSGDGTWARLITVRVDASGNIPVVSFGVVFIPRIVGFRFRYTGGQGSGIANGESAPENFRWCPVSGCE